MLNSWNFIENAVKFVTLTLPHGKHFVNSRKIWQIHSINSNLIATEYNSRISLKTI